jgi:hypothetical protein
MAKIKTALGSELFDFYKNHFPDGCYLDDTDMVFMDDSGECALDPHEWYSLSDCGAIVREDNSGYENFSKAFLRWKERQTHVRVVITVPKDYDTAALAEGLHRLGAKLLGE